MSARKLLEGIVILDFTQYVASAQSTRILADMGAEIIKVERAPHGDLYRVSGVLEYKGTKIAFANTGAGKKSLCVDLKQPEGVALVKRLIPHVDALMEGFTPDQMAKYGLDYETVRAIKPDIVYTSMSSFGQRGPFREWVSFDPIIQALGGMMHATGEPNGPPQVAGNGIADTNAAVNGCLATVAALLCKERTGIGQHVDVCMLDSLVQMDCVMIPMCAGSDGEVDPKRYGRHSSFVAPFGVYECQGEYVFLQSLGSGRASMWGRFCRAIGREDMIDDPRFDTNEHRLQNMPAMIGQIQAWFDGQASAMAAADYLQRHRVAAAPVLTVKQVVAGEHVAGHHMLRRLYHPEEDREITIVANPYRYSETPTTTESGAPLLGQHNEDVLQRYLGYTPEQLVDLYERRVIQQNPKVRALKERGILDPDGIERR